MKIFRPLTAVLIALLTVSMVGSENSERILSCAEKAGDGAIYLKEFMVSLPRADREQPIPVYRESIILRGNNIYRFNFCNDKGEAIIRIYDSESMLVSSYDKQTDKEFNPINFFCRKTGKYTILINFKDGKAGDAVGIMSHVMK